MKPHVVLVSTSTFHGVPDELSDDGVLENQDLGSYGARLIETAGRCCYDSYGKGRGSEEYHKNILNIGHGSVAEHFTMTFYISRVSRGLTHELVRHRVGIAISQRSTRYVNESESDWVFHPLMEKYLSVLTWDRVNVAVGYARAAYEDIFKEVSAGLERDGVDKITARKQARGAARGTLGNALGTALVWTVNARSLRHFLNKRAQPEADAEIRLLANALYEIALEVIPEYFSDYQKVDCSDGIGYALKTEHTDF